MITQQQYDELKAERDALVAQLTGLRMAIAANYGFEITQGKPSKLAQEYLAEIRAEAVVQFADELAKRVEIPDASPTRIEYYKAAIRHVFIFANKYAAKLRQGSE
ncbi:MAG: hypothetical protein [Podoviridae sp. ctKoA10]|nr:MAG: hypothetical protein [Podoviridae sp. ctKoA10]